MDVPFREQYGAPLASMTGSTGGAGGGGTWQGPVLLTVLQIATPGAERSPPVSEKLARARSIPMASTSTMGLGSGAAFQWREAHANWATLVVRNGVPRRPLS